MRVKLRIVPRKQCNIAGYYREIRRFRAARLTFETNNWMTLASKATHWHCEEYSELVQQCPRPRLANNSIG